QAARGVADSAAGSDVPGAVGLVRVGRFVAAQLAVQYRGGHRVVAGGVAAGQVVLVEQPHRVGEERGAAAGHGVDQGALVPVEGGGVPHHGAPVGRRVAQGGVEPVQALVEDCAVGALVGAGAAVPAQVVEGDDGVDRGQGAGEGALAAAGRSDG